MNAHNRLHLFEGFGIELEYMIVDQLSLNVRPISHQLLIAPDGQPASEIEHGEMAWSNELTHHVIEVKTNGPRPKLAGLGAAFQNQVSEINRILSADHAQLLPTGMHPWMNPDQELELWPYDYSPVYKAFHKVFDCRGHGWANLQSMHLNLPFAGDEEFGRLHAAVRLILPLLPGLAASSPWKEGQPSGFLDTRLDAYARNSRRIPSVTGRVIPERVYRQQDYEATILEPMYADIAPYDPEEDLQEEFLNARGAIARFDRGAIEIRVIDVQECPLADIGIAALTIEVLKRLINQQWSSCSRQQAMDVEPLREIFDEVIRLGDLAQIDNSSFLELFGIEDRSIRVADLWRDLFEQSRESIGHSIPEVIPALEGIVEHGPLARRMINAVGERPAPEQLKALFRELASCLESGMLFQGL